MDVQKRLNHLIATWRKVRIFVLSLLLIIFGAAYIYQHGAKSDTFVALPTQPNDAIATPTPIQQLKIGLKTSSSPIGKETIKPTTASSNSDSNSPSQNQNQGNNSNTPTPSPLSTATSTPTQTTAPTTTPTTQAVNIEVWVRGWQYVNNQQYPANGDVKIFKDGSQIASGSANDVYKASNLPTNSNLSVYFYLSGCGHVKTITTGSSSALFELDFNYSSLSDCV